MSDNLKLKSINQILDKDFFIPSFQRGYRWDDRQVEELLEDILEFTNNDKDQGFYCLQPIVVKEEAIVQNGEHQVRYRVIDGQQRLTTIYILLKYLKELLYEEHGVENIYDISYETRAGSKDFLKNICDELVKNNNENIDFYTMNNTFKIIEKWFINIIKNKRTTKRKFLETIMGSDKKDVKIIWYKINDNESEIDIFTRLNIGKIPLTNSELIKALFVLNTKEHNDRLKLITEWDNIEYTLQEPKFFAFLNDEEYDKPTKIEFIFDLLADIKNKNLEIENLYKEDDKYSFYIFNHLISSEEESKVLWKEVKQYFRIFNELYNSNTYYHLVGFLTNNGKSIKEVITLFNQNSKDDFELALKNLIKQEVLIKKDKTFDDLNYNDDREIINKILFLFNVISTLNSDYTKYPFDRHKMDKWSLEHIHAQNSKQIKKDEHKIELLKSELKYVKNKDIFVKIEALIYEFEKSQKIDSIVFNSIQDEIFNDNEYGDGSSIHLHTISNLALLSRKDNSALNNSVFPAKRDKIKELDSEGSFIPIGTKNVFLKYYSNDVKEAVQWNKEDMEAYVREIKEVLKDYLGENNEQK